MRSKLIDYNEQKSFSSKIEQQANKMQTQINNLQTNLNKEILPVIQDLRRIKKTLNKISSNILKIDTETFQLNKASILDALSGDNSIYTALQRSSIFNTNLDLIDEFCEQTQEFFESLSFHKVHSLQSLGPITLSNAPTRVKDEIMSFMKAYQIPLKKELICLNEDQESSIHLLLTTPWRKLTCPAPLKEFFLFLEAEHRCENLGQVFSLVKKSDINNYLQFLFLDYDEINKIKDLDKILLEYLLRKGVKLTYQTKSINL